MHPKLTFELDLAKDRQTLPENVRLALFRIYQNGISNVLRHAQAKNVNVRFAFDDEQIMLDIRDDGKGFDVPRRWIELVRQGQLGLAIAAERVEAIGGSLKIESQPGAGTLVSAFVPRQGSVQEAQRKRLSAHIPKSTKRNI
jgi:signal transduction histidine kinase